MNSLNVLKMQIRNITKKFEVDYVIKDKWHLPVHKHTHYELQYIIKGKGQHIINGNSFNYEKGDVFITPPQYNHFFIFQERTAICIVKFNEGYFEDFLKNEDFKKLLTRLSASRTKILLSVECRENIGELIQLIMKTQKTVSTYQDIIIKNTLGLILALMADDTELMLTKPTDERIQSVLKYIDEHIKERDLLSIKNIADFFHINRTYFNQYFKKATGSSYKKYIQEYALNIIAQQLIYQDKTLSQISFEFGFSDESHLSRTFKSHFKQTPSSFKKNHQ